MASSSAAAEPQAEQPPPAPSARYITEPNEFGVFRCYSREPKRDPEAGFGPEDACNSPNIDVASNQPVGDPLRPFAHAIADQEAEPPGGWSAPLNPSEARLLEWQNNGSGLKSNSETNKFVHNVILAPDFDIKHFANFSSISQLEAKLDEHAANASGAFSCDDGWTKSSVKISLPKAGRKFASEAAAPVFEVQGVWHRSLVEVIKSTYQEDVQASSSFHCIPHELYFVPPAPDSPSLAEQAPSAPYAPLSSSTASTTNTSPSSAQPGAAAPSTSSSTTPPASNASQPSPEVPPMHEMPPNAERLYSETYNANYLLAEDAKIRQMPRNPADEGLDIEYCVAPCAVWSDSTHLANFGTAALWPIYLYPGSLSKYVRSRPSSFAAQHVCYIPELPDTFQDAYQKIFGEPATKEVTTFCRMHLMQQIWLLLLDEKFMEAYRHGIVVLCADGILRRLFPRFVTYSADYPERTLLACIRRLGRCPCTLCYIQKDQIPQTGTKLDAKRSSNMRKDDKDLHDLIDYVRKRIFKRGHAVNNKHIVRKLGHFSLHPLRNAFSIRLADLGFNFYEILMQDLLHEWEVGNFKAVLIHLLRLLYWLPGDQIQELNQRFRQVPTFGRDTIRRFGRNVSGLKKLAARDFEDILQCIIPCIDGILEGSLDGVVLDLLWEMASWHALAKLRLHTETTVNILEASTPTLCKAIRVFATACDPLDIRELPSEEAARGRRKAKPKKSKKTAPTQPCDEPAANAKGKAPRAPPKQVKLNLKTSKYHGIVHYPGGIRAAGTTDVFSTQTGELEHKRGKRFYPFSKTKDHRGAIARRTQRQRVLYTMFEREANRRIRVAAREGHELPGHTGKPENLRRKRQRSQRPLDAVFAGRERERLSPAAFAAHHQISGLRRHHMTLDEYKAKFGSDPAFQDWTPQLYSHLIGRLTNRPFDGEEKVCTDAEVLGLHIWGDTMYFHKTMRVNYTTYDMRRDQDTVNPRTHPDIMVLGHDEDDDPHPHPYWYARVLTMFHVRARYVPRGAPVNHGIPYQDVEVLYVRWSGRDTSVQGGFGSRRLHLVGFVESSLPDAFGFMDPKEVIRGAHLVPAFRFGRTTELLGPSAARYIDPEAPPETKDEDWRFYYVNNFVDRDMFMRFLGGGVGHRATWNLVKITETIKLLSKRTVVKGYEHLAQGQAPTSAAEEDGEVEQPHPEDFDMQRIFGEVLAELERDEEEDRLMQEELEEALSEDEDDEDDDDTAWQQAEDEDGDDSDEESASESESETDDVPVDEFDGSY
ncbi:hypothetical protein PsYK624_126730 [Phanerochaete sordida]|uniref:Uncharacterized protein n=1 Tax=Phanerochaete sordida TaxID=48140 RepID=A0A9P3LIF0_9APHY|nr:hypothetical protein PsYK624_126730 [Phanerochaete sordida]